MNSLLQTLASPEWSLVVKSLLHTVWQGAIIAAILALALRGIPAPAWRYRLALMALALTLVSGMITWAALKQPNSANPVAAALPEQTFQPAKENVGTQSEVITVQTAARQSVRPAPSWTAWLALTWLCGAALMLLRAGVKISGAERLRRASKPLNDPAVQRLFHDARALLATTRRIRVAVTDQLTSPAVIGFIVPTLILPLSLITTLSHEQIRFILLHELAHVRRGDYLANLFQLFAEALLFFNPAVWWISHQIRREREACCDALAIELSGAPVDYARTLVHVAERGLNQSTAAAPAFGERQGSSSLADRIQRLLVPGYRPALRLTRRAIIASFLLTGILLLVAAAGTRMTIAAILTPQERMERIEKKLAEYDQASEIPTYSESEAARKVSVSGWVRTEDGSPLPGMSWINGICVVRGGSIGTSLRIDSAGVFQGEMNPGNLILSVQAPGFAPLQFGPVPVTGTNSLKDVELVLQRGFPATLQLINASTGEPVAAAQFHARFWTRGASQTSYPEHLLRTATDGSAVLTNATDLPLTVSINIPGYELLEHQFQSVTSGVPLRVALQPAKTVSGMVRDKATGAPIAGANLRLLHEKGGSSRHYDWRETKWIVTESGANGKFEIRQLRSGFKYWLGVNAPGHEGAIVEVLPGQDAIDVQLGPELVVKGSVTGSFEGLQRIDRDFVLGCSQRQLFDGSSHPEHLWLRLRITNGIGHFHFTNRVAGTVTLSARSGGSFSRMIDAPVTDWSIRLEESPTGSETNVPRREVVFRFTNPKGPAPRGTVAVRLPDLTDPNRRTSYNEEKDIVNGEVRVAIPLGVTTSLEPRRMIGFWFDRAGPNGNLLSISVTNGPGPLVIEIPVVPAGAIYARALGPDGAPLGGLFFGVHELKRSPHRAANASLGDLNDSLSDDSPRKWASPALPLDGTYQIYGWRGNSFAVSKPITLTEAEPDAEISLRFPPGKTFEGILLAPEGKPLAHAELTAWFNLPNNHGFGLKPVFTDEAGRFQIRDATPDAGEYSVEPAVPGIMAERIKLQMNTSAPQTIQLKPGLHLGGRVVNESGDAIPGVELRAFPGSDGASTVTTRTDSRGRFHFSTLKDADYTVFVQDAEQLDGRKLPADGNTNHVLRVKLQPWSKVQPRKLELSSSNTSPNVHRLRDPNGQPVELTADYVTFDPETEIFTASNNVVLRHANIVIRANTATLNPKSGEVNAIDGLVDGPDDTTWDAIRYNFNTGEMTLTGPVSSSRKKIMAKLDQLRLETVLFDREPLSNVVRTFSHEVRRADPTRRGVNFLINPGDSLTDSNTAPFDINSVAVSIKPALTNAKLADILDAIVTVADKPIKYSVTDYAVIFSPKGPERPPLYVRTFKVNHPALMDRLYRLNPALTNLSAGSNRTGSVPMPRVSVKSSATAPSDQSTRDAASAVQSTLLQFFAGLGVDLSPQNGKNVFYSDSRGEMMIRATKEELDKIEKALGELNARSSPSGQATSEKSQVAALVQNAKLFYEAGRPKEAEAELDKALALEPGNSETLYYKKLIAPPGLRSRLEPGFTRPVLTTKTNYLRTFAVDTDVFILNLQKAGALDLTPEVGSNFTVGSTNWMAQVHTAVRSLFRNSGIEPQNVFFNPRQGQLIVQASRQELDFIEPMVASLNHLPPQINIRARFAEVPEAVAREFWQQWPATNSSGTGAVHTTLSPKQLKRALQGIEQRGTRLTDGQVTTANARQAQIQMIDLKDISIPQEDGSFTTNRTPIGPNLDVLATVNADEHTVQLRVMPSVTELVGYDDPGPMAILDDKTGARTLLPKPFPRFRVRQLEENITVFDGDTLVLGKPVVTETQLPTGRPQTRAEDPKRHLLVFVTTTLINARGERIHPESP